MAQGRESYWKVSWQPLKIQSELPNMPMQSKQSMQLPLVLQREAASHVHAFIAQVIPAITRVSAFGVMLIAKMNSW